ncbi:MAG TPA: hypothetical protein DCY13_24590, partial [Verrucomicrobiales bacterium]|nr:hypothetical protein [Verrucomicrobiales bacterium]
MSLIEQIGKNIDARLDALGVVLTQGGEPTYVPLQPDAPEWNNEALGPEKLPFARRLAREFLRSWFPGAVAIRSQGKQYPGEALPRWALSLYRRRDGRPTWRDAGRLLLDAKPVPVTDGELPLRFLRRFAKLLGLDAVPIPVF